MHRKVYFFTSQAARYTTLAVLLTAICARLGAPFCAPISPEKICWRLTSRSMACALRRGVGAYGPHVAADALVPGSVEERVTVRTSGEVGEAYDPGDACPSLR